MERRQNDMFMSMLANPQASFDTVVTVGLTAANTSLQDKNTYINNKYVQDQFKDSEGKFDRAAFDKAYDTAKVYYNALGAANYQESLKKQAVYHRDDIMAPLDQTMKGPLFKEVNMPNPYEQVFNLTRLGRIDDPTKSADELAQSHKVLANPTTAGANLENAKWEDSPNDNFFGNFFDTLVMAQWDTDGEHVDPITGEKVKHTKGELKTNQDGEFYYEKLDGRDVYGRRVLNKMNVLTTDGSFWNRYDFFDSDDVNQKSVGGTILKNLALVGSMFIPYVGPWVAGFSVATQLAGFGATLGKMFVGSDSPTLSAIEGWSKSLNRQTAKTEYAQQNTWCWENFINLIGDVAGQLKEQRFVFERIPAVFKGTNITNQAKYDLKLNKLQELYNSQATARFEDLAKKGMNLSQLSKAKTSLNMDATLKAQAAMDSFVKGYQKIGDVLSKGYMTGITVADTYGEAKQAGASDLDATLLTLGYAAGEYAILNTGLGEWILPELRASRYRHEAIAKALTSLGGETESLRKKFGQTLSNMPKEGKKQYFKNLFNIGKKIATAEYSTGARTLKATLAAGAGEGFEEVSEELLADFSKSCFNAVKWLQGDDTRMSAFGYNPETGEWDMSEVLDRYGMSLIGGFVGGGLTNAFTNYKGFKSLNNMTSQKAIQELVYMHRNGETEKFLKSVDKMTLANPYYSATDFDVKEDGQVLFAPGTETNNQDLYAKKALREQVNIISNILDANGANLSDDSFLDKQTLGDIRFNVLHNSTTAGAYLNEFNTLSSRLVELQSQLENKQTEPQDKNQDGTVTDKEKREAPKPTQQDEQIVKNIQSQIKDVKQQLTDLVEGKRSYEFIADSLFEMTTDLSGQFTTITFPLFAENEYKKKFSELTENEKAVAYEKYQVWKTGEGRDKIREISSAYRTMAVQASQAIQEQAKGFDSVPKAVKDIDQFVSNLYNSVQGIDEASWLESAQNVQGIASSQLGLNLIEQFASDQDKLDLKTIQEQFNSINPADENSQDIINSLANQFKGKISDILLNNIDSFIKPVLDYGVANNETKNQLLSVLDMLKESVDSRILELYNNDVPDEAIDAEVDKKSHLDKIINEVSNLQNTAFEKNLDQFSISIGKDPIDISTLITRLNASYNQISDNITQFNIDEKLYDDLENAINTIELYAAAIKGASTNSVDVGNYFGYNATLNEINAKMDQKRPELAEIDEKTANSFIADINVNLNKLKYLKQLYQINQGQKISKQDRVSTKKDLLIYKNLRNIVTIPDDDPLKNWEGFLELQNTINGMVKHQNLLDSKQTIVATQDKEAFEREKVNAENAIYDFFQKNQDKLKDPTKLAEFLSPKRFQLYTTANDLLNEGLENLDSNSMIWWIAGRAALKSSDFYHEYKTIINPTSENPLIPIATQELAVYNAYAHILNGNLFTQFYNAFRYSMMEDWKSKSIDQRKEMAKLAKINEYFCTDEFVDYAANFLPIPRYVNTVLIEGIAGSGKTSAVFQQTVELLKKFHPELLKNVAIVHGGAKTSASKISKNLELTDNNSKAYDRAEFMKEISSKWRDYDIDPSTKQQKISENDFCFTEENEIRSKLGVAETQTPPSLILIDEISKFSLYDLDLIDKFAKKYGISVITAGDFDQSGLNGFHRIQINGQNLRWITSLSRINFIRSPKLGVSMRTDNTIKTQNQYKLQAFLQNPNSENMELGYYQDETGLYGDKLILYSLESDNIDQTKEVILSTVKANVDNLIKTLKKGEKIGYIFDDINSPIYKLLTSDEYSSFIDTKSVNSAQGLEGQYYIIEPNLNTNFQEEEINEYLKNIYTGITRAEQGSLVIVPQGLGPKFSNRELKSKINEGIKPQVIQHYASKRKELFDKVITDGKNTQYIPKEQSGSENIKTDGNNSKGLEESIDNTVPQSQKTEEKAIVTPNNIEITPSHSYTEIESSDIEKQLLEELYNLQNQVLNNHQPTEGWDLDDSKTDLKYGQIVQFGENKYGIIQDVKFKPNGEHEYLVRLPGNNTESINYKNITGTVNHKVEPKHIFSHDEMVKEYGDVANISSITINLNGKDIQLPLCQIPFENRQGEGVNNIINFYDRNVVVIDINGFHMPFYMSTGQGGKKDVPIGKWYPFFGIGNDGWLNKTTGEDMVSYYGSPIFKSICEQLNSLIQGTSDTYLGPLTVDVEDRSYRHVEFINRDMNPGMREQYNVVKNNINDAINKAQQAIDSIVSEPVEAEPEKLTYEDNIGPIIPTDTIQEVEYQEQLDNSNQPENLPEVEINNSQILMLLHSFNTFETGVLIGDDGKPIYNGGEEWGSKRIDSVNGLIKIDQLNKHKIRHIEEYKKIIGNLRSIIFNTSDKTELVSKIASELELSDINVRFALKSSPNPSAKNRENGEEFVENTPTPFSKGISERTEYNGSSDEKSSQWNPKSFVIVISQGGKNILELPLLTMSSPFTILKLKEDDAYIYPEVVKRYNGLKEQGLDTHSIVTTLISEFKSSYPSLMRLFEFYDFTDRSIMFMKDPQWTIARDFKLVGPTFVMNRGIFQDEPGFKYDANANPANEWITLDEYKNNPQITMTDVLVSTSGTVVNDGNSYNVAKKGHPFVLISFDKTLSSPQRIVDYYIQQETEKDIPKKVQLVYVLPPKATIQEYIENLKKILNKEGNVQPIGNLFTSYKLLKILTKDPRFTEKLSENLVPKLQQSLSELENLSMQEQKDALYRLQDWTDAGLVKRAKLAGIFDSILKSFVYKRSTLKALMGQDVIEEFDAQNLQLITDILQQNDIDGIYYSVKIKVPTDGSEIPMTGPFNSPLREYSINGKPFRIHGKIDSYIFKGDVGTILDDFFNGLRPSKDGLHHFHQDGYNYQNNMAEPDIPNPMKIKKDNLVKYIKNKINQDFSDLYSEGSISEVNARIVDNVNGKIKGHIAFTVNGELKISNNSDLFDSVSNILDKNGNVITDISNTVNNNGEYKFTIQTNNVEYNAMYKDGKLTLTPMVNSDSNSSNTTITPEIIIQGREQLQEQSEMTWNVALKGLLSTNNDSEFIQYLQESSQLRGELEDILDEEELSEEQKQIINALLDFKKTSDELNSNTCPVNITIFF